MQQLLQFPLHSEEHQPDFLAVIQFHQNINVAFPVGLSASVGAEQPCLQDRLALKVVRDDIQFLLGQAHSFQMCAGASDLQICSYLPFGFGGGGGVDFGPGGLFPLPLPDGLSVVLGPLGGRVVDFAIFIKF